MKIKSPFDQYDRNLKEITAHQSLQLNDDIWAYCKDLFVKTGSEFYTLMISQGQESMILSNLPITSKMMYYKRRLRAIDVTLDIKKDEGEFGRFPSTHFYKVHNQPPPRFLQIMEDDLKVYNHFSLTKACDNYAMKLVLSGSKGVTDFKQHYNKNKHLVEDFSISFVERYKAAITHTIPSMRHSRLFKVDGFLEKMIKQPHPQFYEIPKEQELTCLFFYKEGMDFQEIADVTGYTVNTVKSYLRNVREKMDVSKTYQAAIKAIQDGLIC